MTLKTEKKRQVSVIFRKETDTNKYQYLALQCISNMKKKKAELGIKFEESCRVIIERDGFSEEKNCGTETRILWESQ